MERTEQQLLDWLNEHVNETVVLEKQELDDLDTIHFKLESVDYRNAEAVIDDYLGSALILRGSGSTLNGDNELVPLPQHNYEIAVAGLHIESIREDKVELKTDRAKYALSLT